VPLPSQDHVFNDLTVDKYNRVLLAHRKGILQFDGRVWDKVNTDSTPLKFLKIDSEIYILTRNGIAILKEDSYRRNTVEILFKNDDGETGKDLIRYKDDFYYLTGGDILKMSANLDKIDTTYTSDLGFEDVFVFNNRLFAFEGNFLLEKLSNGWVDLNMYAADDSEFVFSCQNEDKVFFAYDNGDFFAFDGKSFQKFSSSINEYLQDNFPVSGKIIDDRLLIATISGGALVADIERAEIDYTIQYYNGLPADEVKSITLDKQGGIWLAHEAGLSRGIPELPLKEYQHYPGLDGLPEVVYFYNDTLIVGTTKGLFYLAEVRDYMTLEKVLKQRIRIKQQSVPAKQISSEQESSEGIFQEILKPDNSTLASEREDFIDEELKKYKRIYRKQGFRFRQLKERLNKREKDLRDSLMNSEKIIEIDSTPIKKTIKKPNITYSYKTVEKVVNVSKLKSIKHQFQLYSGIDKKIKKIFETKSGLLVLTTEGLYRLDGGKAVKIFSKLFIEDGLLKGNQLWLFGVEGLFSYDIVGENRLRKHLNFEVTDISVNGSELVIASSNRLAIYTIDKRKRLSLKNEKRLINDYAEKILVYHKNDSIKMIMENGLYAYQRESDSLSLEKAFGETTLSYFKDNMNQIWLLSGSEWQILDNERDMHDFIWLKILPNMNRVFFLSDRDIYFVTDSKIVKLNANQQYNYTEAKSFIRGAFQTGKRLLKEKKIKLTHENNTLKISLSTPEYLYPEGIEYQYYIKGLMDKWSDWSTNSEIEFPYIPTGNYRLEIKSKNSIQGGINNFDFKFEVLPPYWQTWWFYLLEIAFFSILIIISLRLNRSNKNNYLTNAITFLTLILFIEFLATVLENNLEGYLDESPVYGFLLNVILALSITPLERFMNGVLVKIHIKDDTKEISPASRSIENKGNAKS